VDLKEIAPLNYQNVKTIVCDIFDYEKLSNELDKILPENHIFDIITSDIAPNTTGVFDVDQYASVELNIAICEFSDRFLKKGGNMLLKVFK
jgi:23S rRNA (uridine2552-2'-O)-methyltransferase